MRQGTGDKYDKQYDEKQAHDELLLKSHSYAGF